MSQNKLIIRHSLALFKNMIEQQIKIVEKSHTPVINSQYLIEVGKLEQYVNKYNAIEKAMKITNYSELPIQK